MNRADKKRRDAEVVQRVERVERYGDQNSTPERERSDRYRLKNRSM